MGAGVVGIGAWAAGATIDSLAVTGGVVALWCFVVCAGALAFVLPLPGALVSPLFIGLAGWLVDMLPLLVLAGAAAVVARWLFGLLRERRAPRGGRWRWIPVGLLVWTALGVLVITSLDLKHFLLLLAIQAIASGIVLVAVDQLTDLDSRIRVLSGLCAFIVILSAAVFLQWVGVPVQALQSSAARRRVEAAYGLDAFPNSIGMIKYARSVKAGSLELRRALDGLARRNPGMPHFEVFRPKFQAYENHLVIRFEGSARPFAARLRAVGVDLLYDNVGLAPASTVPRLRSFPRNALTYAGVSAALLPLAFFLVWSAEGRRRLLGWCAVVSCLFGAGFSLARGAWAAAAIGVVYLAVDGVLSRRRKLEVAGAVVAGAVVLTGVFLVKYHVDPLTGRAGGGASVNTRGNLYEDTVGFLDGIHLALGYGTERPRTPTGSVHEGTRYVPRAGTHSTYLNYLFRTGVPGALGILALYVLAALHARAAARSSQGSERTYYTLATTSIVSAGAHATILSLYVEPIYTVVISVLLGLAMAGATSLNNSVIPWRSRAAQ